MYTLQVRRGSSWRGVDETADGTLAYSEVNELRRSTRRRVAVRLLLNGTQVGYWAARR